MKTVQFFDGHHSFFSPNGKSFAMVYDNELTVRSCKTLDTFQVFHCPDPIKAVKWSPDSRMVLCAMPRRNIVEIFAVDTGDKAATLECFITNGGRCFWGTSSNVILVTEPFLLRAVLWPLDEETSDTTRKAIHGLQPWAKPCVDFSPDGQWLAVVQSKLSGDVDIDSLSCLESGSPDGDSVALFSSLTWRMSKRIKCNGLSRVVGISWSPCSKVLAIWSDGPNEPVVFADVPSGDVLSNWLPEASDFFAGLIEVSWSPSAQFIALMTYNDKVFVLSAPSWETVEEITCKEEIISKDCDVYHEVSKEDDFITQPKCIKLNDRPVSIARMRQDVLFPTSNDPSGSGSKVRRRCLWSSGGRFLAVNSVFAPAAVWIWNVPEGLVLTAVVVLSDRLLDLSWDPVFNSLAMCCGQASVVVWNREEGAKCVSLSSDLPEITPVSALRLAWSPSATMMIVAAERTSYVLRVTPRRSNVDLAALG